MNATDEICIMNSDPERKKRATRLLERASVLFAAEMESTVIEDPETTAPWFRAQIGFDDTERFAAVFLDHGRRILSRIIFDEGSRTRCVLYPRKLFQAAFECNATGIILSHNHPGGSLQPNPQDRELTKRILEIGQAMEITLVYHLIVTREGYTSMRRHGWM